MRVRSTCEGNMYKRIGLVSSSLTAIAAATGAYAADDGQKAGQVPEIVVTATKQATNLQNTPIAITAVTSERLAQQGIQNTADLGAIVPNATFRENQGAFGKGVSA